MAICTARYPVPPLPLVITTVMLSSGVSDVAGGQGLPSPSPSPPASAGEPGRGWRQSRHWSDVPPTMGTVPASAKLSEVGMSPICSSFPTA